MVCQKCGCPISDAIRFSINVVEGFWICGSCLAEPSFVPNPMKTIDKVKSYSAIKHVAPI